MQNEKLNPILPKKESWDMGKINLDDPPGSFQKLIREQEAAEIAANKGKTPVLVIWPE